MSYDRYITSAKERQVLNPTGSRCGKCSPASYATSTQTIYKFPNGHGASVVQGPNVYGSYELAVLDSNGKIDYKTGITDDVEGWLDDKKRDFLLAQIMGLS